MSELYKNHIKRILDITLSSAAIVALSPVMGVTALLVKKKLGSPVIFKQKRPGKDEKIFTMYKFRTMTDQKDSEGNLLPDEVRLTKFGKTLRSTSLDELPELFNIFKGDMSVVGPRPQLVRDMVFMTDKQRERHTVRPGLTGWAQINGRNDVTWEEKLDYDLEYLARINFIDDFLIVLQTVRKVSRKDGISENGMETAMDYGDYLLMNQKINQDLFLKNLIEASELLNS